MNYCKTHSRLCENADEFGYCSVTACTKSEVWNNTYSSNTTYNLTTESRRDDGIYMQLFCVKDGIRYDMKVVSLKDVSTTLTNSLMDGIEKLYTQK